MELFDRVKVDLYGQYNNNTEHAYSYPDKITNQYSFTGNTAWAAAISDPRALFQSVCSKGPCYQIYRHKNGYYYSMIVRNQADSRSGLEMVTIFVPNGSIASGDSILAALRELETLLVAKHDFNDGIVSSCLKNIKESHSQVLFPNKIQESTSTQPSSAFRAYRDEAELNDIFNFLTQHDYANIDKLLIVAESDLKEGTSIQRLRQPIRRLYNIIPANDAKADSNEVAENEKLKITFSKVGFEPHIVVETLNLAQSPYYHICGNNVFLRTSSEANITFDKRIFLQLNAAEGPAREIRYAEIAFDGHLVNRDANGRPFVLVSEDSIFAGSKVVLQVTARGYEPYQDTISLENLDNNSAVHIQLTPVKKTLRTVFHFGGINGEERSFPPVELPFNETDPMLEHIMVSQDFFGYRAYRSGSGEFHVNIPRGHHHMNEEPEDRSRRMPLWLKVAITVLVGLFIAIALLLGGYAIRNYTNVKIPGLYTTSIEKGDTQPEQFR